VTVIVTVAAIVAEVEKEHKCIAKSIRDICVRRLPVYVNMYGVLWRGIYVYMCV